MAQYVYICSECGEQFDKTMPIGTALRQTRCECGGVMRLRIGVGVNVAPSALETKGADVRAINSKESRWEQDMPAYKRMRHHGLQPDSIDGSARLEDQVGDQTDIKYKPLLDAGIPRTRIEEGQEQAQEIMADGVPL